MKVTMKYHASQNNGIENYALSDSLLLLLLPELSNAVREGEREGGREERER
jgi:hypothetical protein